MKDWSARQYSKFLDERTLPSIDLVSKISISNPRKIIDIGCGPGNSTGVLKARFSKAQIFGADLSENMLETAKNNHPDIEFFKFDANSDFPKLDASYDVVFSNACIQWIKNQENVIKNMFSIVAPGGILAVQVPVNFNEPIHVTLETLGKSDKWFGKIGIEKIFFNEDDHNYFDIVSSLTNDFRVWETTYCHRVKSHEDIIEWYRGTCLRPYLDCLSEEDGRIFCSELLELVKKEYPVHKNGEILLKFPRYFFTAKKS